MRFYRGIGSNFRVQMSAAAVAAHLECLRQTAAAVGVARALRDKIELFAAVAGGGGGGGGCAPIVVFGRRSPLSRSLDLRFAGTRPPFNNGAIRGRCRWPARLAFTRFK